MSTSYPSHDKRVRPNQPRDAGSMTLREQVRGILAAFLVLLLAMLLRSL